MSQLGVILQESVRRERDARTILGFLREQMDGVDEERGRRRTLKERLGLRGMGCCGATWGFRTSSISVRDNDDDDDDGQQQQRRQRQDVEAVNAGPAPTENNTDTSCTDPVHHGSGMNLAAALAAERQFRTTNEPEGVSVGSTSNVSGSRTAENEPGTPLRVSLMRLLEETDGGDAAEKEGVVLGAVGNDSVCCVCMGRKKGAAFIPCGHTFCRVCSRELWLNRGSCPLCNRSILEILDIF
ncbi:hypothetical protein FNV43_RR07879 [Rhamnella rubrinervis]|uniref:RING-type domain-containing protein n=1 Tax=Rhamnella rubrinervis TaxID=2594499 RepID=A0A8K0HHH6_9ROSA|nr:hypothetical protein FNV43_RR07879 [Rhamnella rubrinervis]